jgi:hypothetical protein
MHPSHLTCTDAKPCSHVRVWVGACSARTDEMLFALSSHDTPGNYDSQASDLHVYRSEGSFVTVNPRHIQKHGVSHGLPGKRGFES